MEVDGKSAMAVPEMPPASPLAFTYMEHLNLTSCLSANSEAKSSGTRSITFEDVPTVSIYVRSEDELVIENGLSGIHRLGNNDLHGADISTASSILTADGIADPTSFRINCLAIFVADMAKGIFFPTMWNLVQMLGGDQVLLGYANSSFNFGRMLVMPVYGAWSTSRGYRWTLLLSTFILLIGTLMFGQVLRVGKPWYLCLSNVILGLGSGTLAVTRAYTSEVTPTRMRTGYMALISSVQYAGTTTTPLLGSLFILMFAKNEGKPQQGLPEINEFTAPVVFMTFATLCTIYLLYTSFEEIPSSKMAPLVPRKVSEKRQTYNDFANSKVCFGRITVYTACLVGCMFLNSFLKGPMSCFETLGIEFAESHFDMGRGAAGTTVAVVGLLGALSLLAMKMFITQYFDDIELITTGYTMFIIGILMNTLLDRNNPENNPKWRYAISMFFCYSIGYPICHVALIGLFSKVVGRKPQGTLLGLFASVGSTSRVLFPVLSGYIVRYRNIETLFYLLASMLAFSLMFVIIFRRVLRTLSST